jgi:hypothetical protein
LAPRYHEETSRGARRVRTADRSSPIRDQGPPCGPYKIRIASSRRPIELTVHRKHLSDLPVPFGSIASSPGDGGGSRSPWQQVASLCNRLAVRNTGAFRPPVRYDGAMFRTID